MEITRKIIKTISSDSCRAVETVKYGFNYVSLKYSIVEFKGASTIVRILVMSISQSASIIIVLLLN
jgi:hypothetical protein